jgi:sec-independent protein translocase protein TatA
MGVLTFTISGFSITKRRRSMFGPIGWPEIIIILIIALLLFGAKRLPEIGKSMGKAIREFKKSFKDVTDELDEDEPSKPEKKDTENK